MVAKVEVSFQSKTNILFLMFLNPQLCLIHPKMTEIPVPVAKHTGHTQTK